MEGPSKRRRRPSFCQTEYSHGSSLQLNWGMKRSTETLWNPGDANPDNNGASGNASKNLIDRRSLYAIKRENIASRDLKFRIRPNAAEGDRSRNVDQQKERDYIHSSRLTDVTVEKFPKVIMKHFYRMSGPTRQPGYGMPRPATAEDNPYKLIIGELQREPSIVNVNNYPSLISPLLCDRMGEFCEILGPSSCSDCIEKTNRHIGEELQNIIFPSIDISPQKLIGPKLAKALKNGHKLQVRKRRMRELGLELPTCMSMKRDETNLTSSTCLKCKKKFSYKTSKPDMSSASIPDKVKAFLKTIDFT